MEVKKVVLSIDDDPQQLQEYKAFLSQDYDFRAVKAASEALNFLNENKVDIILLDVLMPNISGFEFLGDIRKIPSYMNVPIIIVSGSTESGFVEKARNSSANGFLAKPVKAEELVGAIEKAFSASRQ